MKRFPSLFFLSVLTTSLWAQEKSEKHAIYRSDTLTIFVDPGIAPLPKGGFAEYLKWIEKNRLRKLVEKKHAVQRKVYIGFTVDEAGTLSDLKIIKGLGDPFDAEAMRLVRDNPIPWTAGRSGNEKVKTRMMIPIAF